MDDAAPVLDLDDARGVPIADVCDVLGVPMPTLRSWELRYAMPSMRHVHSRHRRYLPVEVHAIKLMRDEIARGQPAGMAAATVRRVPGIGGPAAVFINRPLEESERLDSRGMRTTLDQAALALGLGDCVLLPTMRQLGIWWEIGHCDIAQERGRRLRLVGQHLLDGRHPGQILMRLHGDGSCLAGPKDRVRARPEHAGDVGVRPSGLAHHRPGMSRDVAAGAWMAVPHPGRPRSAPHPAAISARGSRTPATSSSLH